MFMVNFFLTIEVVSLLDRAWAAGETRVGSLSRHVPWTTASGGAGSDRGPCTCSRAGALASPLTKRLCVPGARPGLVQTLPHLIPSTSLGRKECPYVRGRRGDSGGRPTPRGPQSANGRRGVRKRARPSATRRFPLRERSSALRG